MKETFILIAFFAIIILFIYTPVIFCYINCRLAERKFQNILRAITDEGFWESCRIIITTPLGTGSEPASNISFADALINQDFAMKSIMPLLTEPADKVV